MATFRLFGCCSAADALMIPVFLPALFTIVAGAYFLALLYQSTDREKNNLQIASYFGLTGAAFGAMVLFLADYFNILPGI